MKNIFLLPVFAAALFISGCQGKTAPQNMVRLATTTSVRDTGLLDALTPIFQQNSDYTLQAIAVGSGQAMQLGKTGEADILLVHSPADEKDFVDGGYGLARTTFMHNDFVLLGPAQDPAGVKQAGGAAEAFKKIAAGGLFVSRGDQSGTHKKELSLWTAAGVKPAKAKYLESGQGMAATLSIANEKKAYCLADRGTYLSMKNNLALVVLNEGDEALINRYSLILVNPAKFPKVNTAGANAFLEFMLSVPARNLIEKYGVDKYGQQLFYYDYAAK